MNGPKFLPTDWGPPRAARRGFTLVELLIVVTIIGLLAGMVFAALNSARTTAKISKTKSTITKLHYLVLGKYDSYQTRRIPLNLPPTTPPPQVAAARVNAIRDQIRLEMPDRWTDVYHFDGSGKPLDTGVEAMGKNMPLTGISPPSLLVSYRTTYWRAYEANGKDASKLSDNAAAECLYMIVMNIPEAAEQFHSNEIGDVDNDGLPEFIDGWGHAIRFIRWPVGFVDYNNLLALKLSGDPTSGPAGCDNESVIPWSSPSDLQSGDRVAQPDPFDPRAVAGGAAARFAPPNRGAGYAVYPLIYSAGPDGIYDINFGSSGNAIHEYVPVDNTWNSNHANLVNLQPYFPILDPYYPMVKATADSEGNTLLYVGQPQDAKAINGDEHNGALDHYDNVHNHRLETGRGG